VQLSLRGAAPVVAVCARKRILGGSEPAIADRRQVACSPGERKGNVQQTNVWPLSELTQNCAEQLSRFFPQVSAVRVPVQVTAVRPGTARLREATVLEFGGTEHAIFLSTLPLEFADRVKLESSQNAGVTEGSVVAVQYHEGRKAVAIRFLHGPCHWVTQT
jgi:hypothetical protein